MFLGLQLYQFVVVALSAVMIFDAADRYLRGGRGQTALKLLVRLAVWGSMGAVTLFPTITYTLARFIGLEGNINAVILIGFLLVFLIIFKILAVIERIEHEISLLTRRDALDGLKNQRKGRSGD